MSSLKNLNVLILGGAGFIGKSLSIELRKRGHKVRVVDCLSTQIHGDIPTCLEWINEYNVDFIRGSVLNKDLLLNALSGIDTIVHLAAETGTGQSMYCIERYNLINTQATALLMDIIVNNNDIKIRRFVLASSRSVYGEGAYRSPDTNSTQRIYPDSRSLQDLRNHLWDFKCPHTNLPLIPQPTREIDKVNPGSIYAATKYAQEDLVRITCRSTNIDSIILRLQNVYGEGQSLNNPYTGILSIFSTRARRGLPLPIFEDGYESRDFVHITDVTRSFIAAIEASSPINSIINVGSGVASTILEVASNLVNYFNSNSLIEVTSNFRLGDIRHNYADITRLMSILDIKPLISLSQGLNKFARWAEQQPLPSDKLDVANEEMRSRRLMQ
jgi:dTDP-L-rhamnose 4-epimerase